MTALRSLARVFVIATALAGFALAQSHPAFAVKISGHGQPMVLIPGLASSGATWDSTVTHYRANYTCYVLTLAGFAGQPPIPQPLLLEAERELAAYIAAHKLQHPVIIGHSLGGNIALDLAERHPALVGPVVIVDSLPFYAGSWFQVKTLAQAQPILAQVKAGMAQETQAQYLAAAKSGAATNAMTESPAHQQTLDQWGAESDMRTVNGAMLGLMSEDLRPGLARVTSPVLLLGTWAGFQQQLAGRGVKVTRADFVATFRQQYAALPHLHFAMADHSRHFIMWDDPAWFFQQLDAFLAHPQQAVRTRGF
ncbi:MAG: alpha/beta fold hydrolase [Terriglobales bacterium]